MSRNPFGWSYPAGAENDPDAPYNAVEPPDYCPVCQGDNSEAPEDVYPYCCDRCAAIADPGDEDDWREDR